MKKQKDKGMAVKGNKQLLAVGEMVFSLTFATERA